MTDYDKIRSFEYNILDKYYEKYEFYQFADDIVIPYLLQTYGDIERRREYLVRNGLNEINLSSYLTNMLHGIGHCIRWMLNKQMLLYRDGSGITYRQIHEMSVDFLSWGTGYHMIAQEFVAWSRKIKTAILDEKNKTITFLNPERFDYKKIYGSQQLYAKHMAKVYASYPHDQMETEFSEWIKEIYLNKPPIVKHINWKRARYSKAYPLMYVKMKEILFPELDEGTDFNGYNLKQLRQFYALVFLNFHFIRWVEEVLDEVAGDGNLSFGSNPLYLNQHEFEKLISDITGLEIKVSAAIINDLTFSASSFHTSVSIQPFIRSSSGTYYILPNFFAFLEPSRMILGALNKGRKKKLYDSLINSIEKVNLNLIYERVRLVSGCISYKEKLVKERGTQIFPDLILIDISNKFLLVADYKHFIGPITASEVDYKMRELEKGINQVNKYIEHLKIISKIGLINIQDFKVSGLIITHKPLPVPIPISNVVPIVDKETFLVEIDTVLKDSKILTDLFNSISMSYFQEPTVTFEDYESQIEVGEWKIKRKQHKIIGE